MLLSPSTLLYKLLLPNATFEFPIVTFARASFPIAKLLLPLVKSYKASKPIAVLFKPEVKLCNASVPKDKLLDASIVADPCV